MTDTTEKMIEALRQADICLRNRDQNDRERHTLSLIRAALSATQAGNDVDEFGWLIEVGGYDGRALEYYDGLGWTTNHLEAVRHARKEDAERVAAGLDHELEIRCVEHAWINSNRKDGGSDNARQRTIPDPGSDNAQPPSVMAGAEAALRILDEIEREAFSIPPCNRHTPAIVQLVIAARAALAAKRRCGVSDEH